ncbi:MAG: hypothetical protein V8S08_00635 [Lachnoclostridium sp.]
MEYILLILVVILFTNKQYNDSRKKETIEKVIYIYIRRYNIKKDKGKRREKNSYESIIHKESEENKDNIIVFINEDKVVSIF